MKQMLLLLVGLFMASAMSGSWAATLEEVEFTVLPDDVVQVRMGFDGRPPEPAGYSIDTPARIAIDLVGASNGLEERYMEVPNANLRSMTVVETRDRTRVILNLVELQGYDTDIVGNDLVVRIGGAAEAATQPTASAVARAATTSRPASSSGSAVQEIDFRRGVDGEGRVIVGLSNPKAPVDVRSEGNTVRVEIMGTDLPVDLRRRLDVTDFATPVELIDAVQEGGSTVITIRAGGDWEYLAYQADDVLTVNIQETREDSLTRGEDPFRYKGEKLSLNFQDIEVRSVLQLIADFTDLNLVASDTVSGRITLRLQNVPWDQALDIILRNQGLDKREIGNVLMVAPAAEIAAREQQELENRRQFEDLAPLRTEYIRVRYADAVEMLTLFESGEGERSMLSERGHAIIDERTNTIILTETAERIESILRVVQAIDIPVRQVLIEARIVRASTSFNQALGIQWGGLAVDENNSRQLVIGGENAREQLGEVQQGNEGILPSVVNLPAGGDASFLNIGLVADDYILDLQLSASEADGNSELVARPKVLTADKQTATIEAGTQIPYQEASSSGATSVSFQDAVLALEVTPQITPDDNIIMELQVNNDSVGDIVNGIPSIDTQQVTTQVLVGNGQTLVLGGIFNVDRQDNVTKTPFLGDLPYVGRLFKRTQTVSNKDELLIFITPRIVEDAFSSR